MNAKMLKKWFKSWKRDYLKPKPIVRFLIILLFTIWLNFFVFTTIKIPTEELNKMHTLEDNTTYLEIPKSVSLTREDLDAGNLGGVLWRLIYFRSKADMVCFENKERS